MFKILIYVFIWFSPVSSGGAPKGPIRSILRSKIISRRSSDAISTSSPTVISEKSLIDNTNRDYISRKSSTFIDNEKNAKPANRITTVSRKIPAKSESKRDNHDELTEVGGKSDKHPKRKVATRISENAVYDQIDVQKSSKDKPERIKSAKQQQEEEELGEITRIAEEERLQKVMSRAGVASRRAAEKMILDGRVTVNGNIVTELGTKVLTRKDVIAVDGRRIVLPDAKAVLWVAVHKPRGVLSTMDDERERETVLSLVPKAKELRLLSVGRLDRDTTGLIILTNDNGWIHPLTHPSFVHKRRYEIVAKGIPTEEALESLKRGFLLPEEKIPTGSCLVNVKDVNKDSGFSLLDVTIEENLPRQVQRILEFVGCEVVGVKRLEFGPIKLQGLRKGDWRELTQLEVERLKLSCVKSPSAAVVDSIKKKIGKSKLRRPGSGYVTRTELIEEEKKQYSARSEPAKRKR